MADSGDHAYSHALAVVRDPDQAAQLAGAAVRRGGRSTTLVLAHVHRDAVAAAGALPSTAASSAGHDGDAGTPEELGALARALTGTRPAEERAIIDLAGRHGLDRVRLGRILGCSADDAAGRVAAVAAAWQQTLDPVLLVRLGPGPCTDLAELLTGRGLWDFEATAAASASPATPGSASAPPVGALAAHEAATPAPPNPGPSSTDPPSGSTGSGDDHGDALARPPRGRPAHDLPLADLLAAAPAVGAHAATCATCGDRLRAIVSVRDLVTGAPLERAPEAVRLAARSVRLRTAVFPPVDGTDRRRLRARATAVIAVLIVLLFAGGLTAALSERDGGDEERVAELARVPAAGGDLQVRPTVLRTNPLAPVVIRNEGDSDLEWRIETGAAWLTATPSEGALAAGKGVSVRLSIGDDAPEGDVRAAVNVVADDGSTASVRIETSVERPPDVDASATGCSVIAAVEDESEITAVVLQYRRGVDDPVEERRLFGSDRGFTGSLPPTTDTLTWWVTATDARGNVTKGSESLLPAGCTPSP